MTGKLRIREDVVQSCLVDGQRSVSMFTASQNFTDSMAEAAGPNGPLKGVLKEAENGWRIRRQKMIEVLTVLIQTIRDVNQTYEDLDKSFGEGFAGEGRQSGKQTSQEGVPGSTAGMPSPQGNAGVQEQQPPTHVGGSPTLGSVHPLPEPTEPGSPQTNTEGDLRPEHPLAQTEEPTSSHPPQSTSDLEPMVTQLVTRWADLTGQPESEAWALLVGGMSVGGLVSLIRDARSQGEAAGGEASDAAHREDSPAGSIDGTTVGSGLEGGSDSDLLSAEDEGGGDAAQQDASGTDSPTSGHTADIADDASDAAAVATPPDTDAPDESMAAEAVAEPEVVEPLPELGPPEDLIPDQVEPAMEPPAELPDLRESPAAEVSNGESSPNLELPSLITPEESPSGGRSVAEGQVPVEPLPDLEPVPPVPDAGGGVPTEELPDLTTDASPRSAGFMPMAGGIRAGGRSSSQAPAVGGVGRVETTADDRRELQKEAREILGDKIGEAGS